MDKEKELLTFKEFISINHSHLLFSTHFDQIEEIAVLFAKWHVREAKKKISNYIKNNAEIDNSDEQVDLMVENAYKEDRIK